MKGFLKLVGIFLIPFAVLVAIYFYTDIFKVTRHYEQYYTDTDYIGYNRAYVSTMTYLNQRQKYHYDSFIFGNSRSAFYEVKDWQKYLPEGSSCFHFDASSGSVKGVHDKVLFIDRQGDTIKNAMLVIDYELLSRKEITEGHTHMSPPILDHNKNFMAFHAAQVEAFMQPQFLYAVADYNISHKFKSYMKEYLSLADTLNKYDQKINERRFVAIEKQIKDSTYFKKKEVLKKFKNRQKPGTFSQGTLDDERRQLLQDIREVFDKHHTNYQVILGPQYDQIKINKEVLSDLYNIFGKERVHDFTGVNKWNQDFHNYYENSHYRPHVAAEVMKITYQGN